MILFLFKDIQQHFCMLKDLCKNADPSTIELSYTCVSKFLKPLTTKTHNNEHLIAVE